MAVIALPNKMKRRLTHTVAQTFKNCQRLHYYRNIELLTPIVKKQSLRDGGAVHKGIEHRNVEKALAEFEGSFPSSQEEADQLEKTRAWLGAAITGYLERFPPFEESVRELQFELPIINPHTQAPSRTFALAGKADEVVRIDGRYWLVEIKTASQLGRTYVERLPLDTQITTYVYALNRLGYDVAGVIYRVIRKPSIEQRKGETLSQFCDRVRADYKGRPNFYFYEEKLYRSRADLEEFERELWALTQAMLTAEREGWYYKNTSKCAEFGGCPYIPLCRGEDALHMYEVAPPNPELEEAAPNGPGHSA